MRYLFFIVVSAILFLAFSPGHFTPKIFFNHDKLAHFCAFFVLSIGMNFSFSAYSIRRLFVVMAFLAIGIEVIQYLFTSREFSIIDFAAGMVGVFTYLVLLKITVQLFSGFGKSFKTALLK